MFIIYGRKNRNNYISGIFKNQSDAENYLRNLPEKVRKYNFLEEIPQNDYPIYFIEEFEKNNLTGSTYSKISPIDRRELAKKLAIISKIDDEGHVYFNYYRFTKDYQSFKLGEDSLGRADHCHVDNYYIIESINKIIEHGEVGYSNCYFYCNMCGKPGAGIFKNEALGWDIPKDWSKKINTENELVFCNSKCQDGFLNETS